MAKPLPKAKSPPRLSFQERENLILDAATDIFSEKGFDGSTTRAISGRARINEALLFRHYPKKESLYSALLRRKISRLFEHVILRLEKFMSEPLSEALFMIARTFIAEHKKDPGLFRMMLYSALEGHHQSRFFFRQKLPFVDFTERLLAEKKREGLVKNLDIKTAARSFLNGIHGYLLMTQVFKAKHFYPKPEEELFRE